MSRRELVVSLHDVSPHTDAACAQIIAELEPLGVNKTSLLVIPDHHHRGHFLKDPGFRTWLTATVAKGHEPVIHGYYHQRERRTDESAVAKLTTRVYTADEGEFFDIDRAAATALVEKARGEFRQMGLEPTGFIAPAWLLSAEGEAALRDLGIHYTTRLGTVLNLRTGTVTASQSLVWSVRAAWRRVTSLAWNATLFRVLRRRSLLRISIHPVDIRHAAVWAQIKRLTAHALKSRTSVTYEESAAGGSGPASIS
jgi:predicted deacetylase